MYKWNDMVIQALTDAYGINPVVGTLDVDGRGKLNTLFSKLHVHDAITRGACNMQVGHPASVYKSTGNKYMIMIVHATPDGEYAAMSSAIYWADGYITVGYDDEDYYTDDQYPQY
jgi:hypothetical protein